MLLWAFRTNSISCSIIHIIHKVRRRRNTYNSINVLRVSCIHTITRPPPRNRSTRRRTRRIHYSHTRHLITRTTRNIVKIFRTTPTRAHTVVRGQRVATHQQVSFPCVVTFNKTLEANTPDRHIRYDGCCCTNASTLPADVFLPPPNQPPCPRCLAVSSRTPESLRAAALATATSIDILWRSTATISVHAAAGAITIPEPGAGASDNDDHDVSDRPAASDASTHQPARPDRNDW